MDRIRFCLIGAGRAGTVHARNVAFNIKNAQLVAIVDNNKVVLRERGEELNVKNLYTNLDDALSSNELDAVIVVTPTFTHRDIVVKCAEAKLHIFCEKPMAIHVSEAEDMNSAADSNDVKLQIGFMRRFDTSFRRAKELIESGDLGEVMIIKSIGRGPGLPPPWTYNVSESNGLLGEVNSHDFDSTRWLVGSEYEKVYVEASNKKTKDIKKKHPDFYDNAVCTVKFKNDVIGTIDGTCPAGYGYDARTEIVMTGGLISIGETRAEAFFCCNEDGILTESTHDSWRNRFKDAYLEELKSFINSIIEDTTTLVTGEDGKAAVKVVVAANRSIKEGVPVEV
ncbi:MAG: Gfo/Idh/MocA family oxidoreductase [Spirochaetota bacterium]|nr:MAG: Gfo/Idh/MocA family oxidoreductase [Spirochaetota bacterium]